MALNLCPDCDIERTKAAIVFMDVKNAVLHGFNAGAWLKYKGIPGIADPQCPQKVAFLSLMAFQDRTLLLKELG